MDGNGQQSTQFSILTRSGQVVTTIPTIGFNVETVEYKNLSFTVWAACFHVTIMRRTHIFRPFSWTFHSFRGLSIDSLGLKSVFS